MGSIMHHGITLDDADLHCAVVEQLRTQCLAREARVEAEQEDDLAILRCCKQVHFFSFAQLVV